MNYLGNKGEEGVNYQHGAQAQAFWFQVSEILSTLLLLILTAPLPGPWVSTYREQTGHLEKAAPRLTSGALGERLLTTNNYVFVPYICEYVSVWLLLVSILFLFIYLFSPCHIACRILFPKQGANPGPLQCMCGVLTTRSPGILLFCFQESRNKW